MNNGPQRHPRCPVCSYEVWAGYRVRVRDGPLDLWRCSFCDLVFQREIARLATYDMNYYSHWTEVGDLSAVWRMKVRTSLAYLDLLEGAMGRPPGTPRLLDIGCAHGFMLEAAARRGFHAEGVEPSLAAEVARERGFKVFQGILEEARFPTGTFDAITQIDVLEHIVDPLSFLRETRRVMKRGGWLLIVTPDVSSWPAHWLRGLWPHYKAEHVCYYSPRSLEILLEKVGISPFRICGGFKHLNFAYVLGHFERYTGGGITGVLRSLYRMTPSALRALNVRLPTELLILAQAS